MKTKKDFLRPLVADGCSSLSVMENWYILDTFRGLQKNVATSKKERWKKCRYLEKGKGNKCRYLEKGKG